MELSRQDILSSAPDVVWSFVSDVERWPTVMRHITRVRRHERGLLGMGSTATLSQPGLPDAVWTVDEFVPGVSFRWWARFLGMRWTADHVVDATQQGGTRLTLAVSAEGLVVMLLRPLVSLAARRALRWELEGFRSAFD